MECFFPLTSRTSFFSSFFPVWGTLYSGKRQVVLFLPIYPMGSEFFDHGASGGHSGVLRHLEFAREACRDLSERFGAWRFEAAGK